MDDDEAPSLDPLYRAIGQAVQEYARVEQTLASLVEAILKTDFQRAQVIFFAAQNVRSRNEMIENLLELEFKETIHKYWSSCSKFLLTLAQFRNAVAHWHPLTSVYVAHDSDQTITRPALGPPVIGKGGLIEENDFAPFLKDCRHIREELSGLIALMRERPSALPEKFQRPIIHRNQAVLQPRRTIKARQRQRPPSAVSGAKRAQKPSAKQRRLRALSATKKKATGSTSSTS